MLTRKSLIEAMLVVMSVSMIADASGRKAMPEKAERKLIRFFLIVIALCAFMMCWLRYNW